MKAILLAAVFIALVKAQTPDQPGSISGRVTSSANQPLDKVVLHLERSVTPEELEKLAGPIPSFKAETDRLGSFVFEGLKPGRYDLRADRPGYIGQTYSTSRGVRTLLRVDPGQNVTVIDFTLIPQAIVTGRIMDENGEPVSHARVSMLHIVFSGGRKHIEAAGSTNTAADGGFTIEALSAGRYLLFAELSIVDPSGAAASSPPQGYVTTFYPGVVSLSSALPINVANGIELRNVDMRLKRSELFRIRGKVIDSNGDLTSDVQLVIASKDSFDMGALMRKYVRPRDGTFELDGLPPGDYTIRSEPKSLSRPVLLVSETVTLSRHDVDDVVLRLHSVPEIIGRITLDGAPLTQQTSASRRLVSLEAAAGVPGIPAKLGTDGTFSIPDVAPGVYHVGISPPPGAYVKSVLFNGQDETRTVLDLTAGMGGRMEVSLTSNSSDVTGVVLSSDGAALPLISVTLWSPSASDFGLSAITDAKGGFRFNNLGPGSYRIAAWERIEPGLAAVAEFRGAFNDRAASIKLDENSHENVVAPLIGRAAIEAEATKLQ